MVEFKTKTKDIVEAITWATKDYDTKNEASYIVFDLNSEGESNIFHENNGSYMLSPISIESMDLGDEDEVKVAVDGLYLKRLASAIKNSGEFVSFSWDDGDAGIAVETENASFTIPIMNFTIPANMKIKVLGEVDDNEYFDSLQRLSKLCIAGEEGYFPVLGTVDLCFNVAKKTLTMMATDRYTLGEITVGFDPNESVAEEYFKEHKHIFLPSKNASIISPTKESLTSVSIVSGSRGDKYGYSFADGKIALFATKDVEELKYKKLKEAAQKGLKNSFIVNTKEIEKAISVISSLAWNEATINLDVIDQNLSVNDNNRQNSFEVMIENVETSDDYKVKFLRSILNNAFPPINTEKVKISWKDSKSAFVFTPILDNGEESDNIFVFCVPSTKDS